MGPILLMRSLYFFYHPNLQMFMTDVIPEVAPRMFALGCSNLRVHVRTNMALRIDPACLI